MDLSDFIFLTTFGTFKHTHTHTLFLYLCAHMCCGCVCVCVFMCGHACTVGYIKHVLADDLRRQRFQWEIELMGLEVLTLSIDHTHKTVKKLLRMNGQQVYNALWMAVNHWGQVRLAVYTYSTGHDELVPTLQRFRDTMCATGQPGLLALWTDDVDKDTAFFSQALPWAKDPVPVAADIASLPLYTLPKPYEVWEVYDSLEVVGV